MNNVDYCVICGEIIPEGTMVCRNCSENFKQTHEIGLTKFVKDYLAVDLKWYQKLLLKLYERSLKIPRKGLHR